MENLIIKTLEFLKGQSIQVAIVFVAVLILTWLLQNKSAHVRYLLWLLVAIKCLTPPLVIFSVPLLPAESITAMTPSALQPIETLPITKESQPVRNTTAAVTPKPMQSQKPIENPVLPVPSVIEASESKDQLSKIYPQGTNNPLTDFFHLNSTGVLLSAWAAGAACYLLLALGKAVRLGMRLKQIRRPLPAQLMIEQIEMLTKLWNYPGGFKVWLVDGINQPFVWGLWRGAIYLPTRFQSIQGDKQKAIVLHEMAHVVRFDAFVNLIQILIQGVFWFHPLVWLANKAIRQEREKCCDEIAVARLGTAPKEYGSAIVDTLLQEAQAGLTIPTLAVAGPVKNIEDRIKTIMQPGRRFFHRPSTIALLIVGVLAVFIIPTTIALTQKVTPPDYTLSGIVTDANDKPIAGAIVFDNGYGPQPYQKGITDDNGKFEYKSWNEEHNIAAKADGYQQQMMTFTTFPLDNSKKLNFKLQGLSGRQNSAIRIKMEVIAVPNEEQALNSLFDQAGLSVPQFAMAGIQGANPQAGQEKLSYGQYLFLSSQDHDNIVQATRTDSKISLLTSPQVIVLSGQEAVIEISSVPNLPKRVSSFKIKPTLTKNGIQSEFDILYLNTIGAEDNLDSRIVSQTNICSNILIPQNKILLMLSPETFKDQNTNQKPPQRLLFLVKPQAEILHDEPEPAQANLPNDGRMPGGMGDFIPAVSSPFTAMLSDGASVELVSICQAEGVKKACWAPDGTLLSKTPYMTTGVVSKQEKAGNKSFEFTLRLSRPEQTSYYWMIPGGSYASDTGMPKDENGNYIPAMRTYTTDQPMDQSTVLVQIGITDSAWETVAHYGPQRQEETVKAGDYEIAFGRAYVRDKETLLPLVHNYNRNKKIYAIRVVAITTSGQIRESGYSGRGGQTLDNLTYSFYDLPMDAIKEFQFQIRPYQWITFHNVSLRPGQKTEINIERETTTEKVRLDAMNQVRQAVLACLAFAGDHVGQLPQELGQLKPYLAENNSIPLEIIELLQAGRKLSEIKDVAKTALLRMQLNDGKDGAIVAYCDGHVEYFSPERMILSEYYTKQDILLLDDSDPEFKGKSEYGDRLYLLDRVFNIKGVFSGFNLCQSIGASHRLAVDSQRKSLWVADSHSLWHFNLNTGDLIGEIPGVKGISVAVDPSTGNALVLTSEGTIYGKDMKVFSPDGVLVEQYPIKGFDIVYNPVDHCFWVAGQSIYKVASNGSIEGQIKGQIAWCAVSVSIDHKTGNAWILERAHSQVAGSADRLWIVDRNVQVKQKIELGDVTPFCVSVDSENETVWVGCKATTLRFSTNGNILLPARQVSAFSVIPGSLKNRVIAADGFYNIFGQYDIQDSNLTLGSLMSDQLNSQLSHSEKWLTYVPFEGAKLKTDVKIENQPTAGKDRLDAMNQARQVVLACLAFAGDHGGPLPKELGQLKPYLAENNSIPLGKIELLQAGRKLGEIKDIAATALLRMQLNDGKDGAIVAFCDGHAEYFSPERMKTPDYPNVLLKPGQKTDVDGNEKKTLVAKLKSLFTACQIYHIDNGKWPESFDDLQSSEGDGPYLKPNDTDDFTQLKFVRPYVNYRQVTDPAKTHFIYDISLLKNHKEIAVVYLDGHIEFLNPGHEELNRHFGITFFASSPPELNMHPAKSTDSELITNNYTATLPNGVAVELVGVCENPSKGKQWWKPDGSLSDIQSEHTDAISGVFPPGNKLMEFLVNIHSSKGVQFDVETMQFLCPYSNYKIFKPQLKTALPGNQLACRAALLPQAETCGLTIGLWTEEWSVIASGKGIINSDGKRYSFSPLSVFKNGRIGATLFYHSPEDGKHLRYIVADKQGNVHSPMNEKWSATETGLSYEAEFEHVSAGEFQEFRIQTRPYQWITFKNVSLKPGQKTDVKIENPEALKKNGAETNAQMNEAENNRIVSVPRWLLIPATSGVYYGFGDFSICPWDDRVSTEFSGPCQKIEAVDGKLSVPVGYALKLDIDSNNNTDLAALDHFGQTDLQVLALPISNKINSAALPHIGRLTGLQALFLGGAAIRDQDIRHLAALTNLKTLNLQNCPLTDDSIRYLSALQSLKELNLWGTAITEQGYKKIKIILPQCDIRWKLEHIAALPNGVTVELVGLCEYPSKAQPWWKSDDSSQVKNILVNKGWWRPDGTPLEQQIITQDSSHYEDKNKAFEIAYRISVPQGITIDMPKTKGSTAQSGLAVKSPADMKAYRVHLDLWGNTTDISFPIAAGPWKTLGTTNGTGQFSSSVGNRKLIFSPAIGSRDKFTLSVADDLQQFDDYRLIAVDKQGKIYMSDRNWSSVNNLRQNTFTFTGLDPVAVDHYEFQSRPFENIEFKNVSLKPGKKTDVKIEIPKAISQASDQLQSLDSQKINYPKNWDEVNKRAEERMFSNPLTMKNEVYDCSELIELMVTNFQEFADNPNANINDLQAKRIDEIQKEIQQIAPESWVIHGGSGRIAQEDYRLVVYQTPEVHKQIRAYLDNKVRELSKLIAIEARIIIVDAVSIAKAGLKEDPAVGVSVTAPVDSKAVMQLLQTKPLVLSDTPAVYTLDDSKAKFVQEVFRQSKSVRQLTAPKAMVKNKEPFNLRIMQPVAYMDTQNNQKSVEKGLALEGLPEITEDGKSVRLAFRLLMTDLVGPKDEKPLPSVPVVNATEIQYASVIPDQQTLWLVGPEGYFYGAAEKTSVPPAKRRLLVLIKPTIIIPEEQPSLPQLSEPVPGDMGGLPDTSQTGK